MPDEPSPAPAPTPSLHDVQLLTSDGERLLAQHRTPPRPRAVASIAHPHPSYGGSMHDAIVSTLWQRLGARDVATLRFAFRGSGGSTGRHGGGYAERADVHAAFDAAAALVPDVPLLACGYSFGAEVTLSCDHERLAAWLVVAPPLQTFPDVELAAAHDPRPVHLFVGAHDPHASPDALRARTAGWTATTIHVIDMADHFFRGSLGRLDAAFDAVLEDLLG
jgi:alpha/beta superfamily hydrolase